ncbi:MAG: hypothetical protein QM811_09100 [Pirellulales bacterium]
MRGAADYRKRLAENFLVKFYFDATDALDAPYARNGLGGPPRVAATSNDQAPSGNDQNGRGGAQ